MLSFLTTLRDTFHTIVVSKSAASRVLAYLVGGDAKDVLSEKFSIVDVDLHGDSPEASEQVYWLHVVHTILRMFLREEVFQRAYDSVARGSSPTRSIRGSLQRGSLTPRGCFVIYSNVRGS